MSEKTEAPTSRRISEARQEGQVARSQELNVAAALLMSAWLLSGPGKRLLADLQGLLASSLAVNSLAGLRDIQFVQAWFGNLILQDGLRLAGDLGLIVAALLFTGVVVTFAQTGLLVSFKRVSFDLKRVNPLSGLKRMFSGQGLFELAKALVKLLVIAWVAYGFLRERLTDLLELGSQEFMAATSGWAGMALALMLRVGAAYLVLAAADYAYQRWSLMRSLRMSKEEVKEEFKRSEGDPTIKGRIRSQQRRMARMRMMANVPKADVVVTNPTHLAVAIQYEAGSMKAPRLLAKGAHLVAERIVGLARQNNVPVIQNIPLARAIYRTVEIDTEIPPELYVAMAEVLAYVYGMKGRSQTASLSLP